MINLDDKIIDYYDPLDDEMRHGALASIPVGSLMVFAPALSYGTEVLEVGIVLSFNSASDNIPYESSSLDLLTILPKTGQVVVGRIESNFDFSDSIQDWVEADQKIDYIPVLNRGWDITYVRP